jgi:hypothetical protein
MRRVRRETGIYYLKRKKQKIKELRSNKYLFSAKSYLIKEKKPASSLNQRKAL